MLNHNKKHNLIHKVFPNLKHNIFSNEKGMAKSSMPFVVYNFLLQLTPQLGQQLYKIKAAFTPLMLQIVLLQLNLSFLHNLHIIRRRLPGVTIIHVFPLKS